MSAGPDRALADALGGFDGGWYFWQAALAALEVAIARSREREPAFCSYPAGELGRFRHDLDDALALARTAVAVQDACNGEGPEADTLLAALVDRVRELGR